MVQKPKRDDICSRGRTGIAVPFNAPVFLVEEVFPNVVPDSQFSKYFIQIMEIQEGEKYLQVPSVTGSLSWVSAKPLLLVLEQADVGNVIDGEPLQM